MNILIITATYPPSANGVAISTKRTVDALRQKGHTVGVIGPSLSKGSEKHYFPFPSIRFPIKGLKDYPVGLPFLFTQFKQTFAQFPWDILHVHHPFLFGRFAYKLGQSLRIPILFTYHTQYDQYLKTHAQFLPKHIRTSIYYQGVTCFCQNIHGVIATTMWLQKQLKKQMPTNRIYYASSAGLSKSFLLRTPKNKLRSSLGISVEGPMFLNVSRISTEKNIEFLIRSFSIWANTHTQGFLVLIGDGNDKDRLEKIVCKLKLNTRVLFTGRINNDKLSSWYSAADIFLYSSKTDTIGVNIIEAMSAGLPVVAIDHETSKEVIRDGYNGVLSHEFFSHYVRAINYALKHHMKLRINALKTAEQFTIQSTTNQLIHIYSDVLNMYKHL